MSKTTYTSLNNLLKAVPQPDGLFTINALIGGNYIPIGTLDAELAHFRPIHIDTTLRLPLIIELGDFMKAMQNKHSQ